MDEPPPRPHRSGLVALVALLVASNAVWFAGTHLEGHRHAGGGDPPEPSVLTAVVEHRRLISTILARGDAAPHRSVPLAVPSSVEGAPVISALAARAGDEVSEGDRPIEVSGRPVIVLAGEVAAYRTMRPGQSGADVAQLQAALTRLGHPSDHDGTYGARTKEGVAALYRSHGYDPPTASSSEPAALAAASRDVEAAEAALDSAGRDLRRASAGPTDQERQTADAAVDAARRTEDLARRQRDADVAGAQLEAAAASDRAERLDDDPEADPEDRSSADIDAAHAAANVGVVQASGDAAIADAVDQREMAETARAVLDQPRDVSDQRATEAVARANRDAAISARDALERSTGAVVPLGEVVFVPELPARVDRVADPTGSGPRPTTGDATGDGTLPAGGEGGGSLMELATGGLEVAAALPPEQAEQVAPGTRAELLDESTGERRRATVRSVDPITSAGDGPARVVHLDGEDLPASWSGTNLRVTFRRAATEEAVLVVPVSAVSSGADGRARVRILDRHRPPRTVLVDVGASADGYVELERSGGRIEAGDRVVIGR